MPVVPLTPATFHILVTLAQGPSHGYAIKRAVEARTDGAVRLGPGTLYAALARMVDAGFVRPQRPPRSTPATSGPAAPVYGLTARGRAALAAEMTRLEQDARLARGVLGARRGTS